MAVGTNTRYICGDEERRAELLERLAAGTTTLNGIDWLEVIDLEAQDRVPRVDDYRQRVRLVVCFTDPDAALTPDQTRIRGGERITPVTVEWVRRLDDLHETPGWNALMQRIGRSSEQLAGIDFAPPLQSPD